MFTEFWLALNVMAHNLARFSTRIGLGDSITTTETPPASLPDDPGRMTRSARRRTLHLPSRWQCESVS
jgi:hypothetical protein